MSLQKCVDISEALPLEVGLGLYLKPASKIKISVQLPKLKTPGQSISTFQVMEKLRAAVRPDLFLTLKALKITSAVIKFLGELETRAASERALARLRAAGVIKLTGFSEWLQIRGAQALCTGPTRHDWDSFFRDARGVNEMKPGERPDTVHLQDLPTLWFSESAQVARPSENLLHKAFATFGRIRRLEIPINNSKSSDNDQKFGKTSSLFKDSTFEAYVQYEEYVEFATAMDSLRGRKLIFKDESDRNIYSAEIKVDFDRTNYLSDKNIQRRALESKKGIATSASNSVEKNFTEKEISSDKDSDSKIFIPQENETKVNADEARLEATSLLKELLLRSEVSEKQREEKEREVKRDRIATELALIVEREQEEMRRKEKRNQEKLIHQEHVLKRKLLRSLKAKEQQKTDRFREKLRRELAGQKLLSVLATNICSETSDKSMKFS